MKELTYSKKVQVIKLFLTGLSYDEIGQQVGIAKGSVVNIIVEFREGYLSLPPGMTEYMDELRHLVVDMKKHGATVSQLMACVKLHAKLQEMGVDSGETDQWLDICHDIASPTVSTSHFVKASLELAQLESDSGLSYADVITDYDSKLNLSKTLDAEIEKKEGKIGELKLKYKEDEQQATGTLNSITKAITTAQDAFHKQKNELKSQLDEYLTQHQLSWKNVNTILAMLNTELGKAGFSQQEMDEISHQIVTAGSLSAAIKQLEHQRDELQSRVNHLTEEKDGLESSVNKLGNVNQKICNSIFEKGSERDELDALIKSKKSELVELSNVISDNITEIRTAYLILSFLITPEGIKNYDIDTLTKWLIAIRQKRLGIGPNQVKDSNGKVICECSLPVIYSNLGGQSDADINSVREKLALCLMPLVKDKFVSKFEYDAAQFNKAMSELNKKLLDMELHITGAPSSTEEPE